MTILMIVTDILWFLKIFAVVLEIFVFKGDLGMVHSLLTLHWTVAA